MSTYDAADVNELVRRFSVPELRREKRNAEMDLAAFESFGEDDRAGKCRAYLQAVSLALDVAIATTPRTILSRGAMGAALIKTRTDILKVAERYTRLRKCGKNFVGLCPAHSEKTPSFYVYPEQQTWHCFGACGKGGDVISLVMAAEHLDFKAAVVALGGRYVRPIESDRPKTTGR